MRRNLLLLISLILMFSVTSNSYADRRSYVWTYEYKTMPKGMAEVEYYMTTELPDTDKSKVSTWKHWLELEYGITDHWDVSMYQQFKQSNTETSDKFEYDGFKLRTRYRIAEKNKLPIDTLLYLEYIRNDNLAKPNVLEGKLVLAKDIEKFNVAYNQILKQELDSDGETEHEYATGISYEFLPALKLGIESKGNYSKEKYAVGPTLSLTTDRFWVSAGAVFGVNGKTDDLQTRMIVGIPF